MRIVCVADTHLFHHELVIPDGDVFVHAGDMCRGGELAELAIAADWIRDLPHRRKVVVAGNHDWALATDADRDRARELFAGMDYLEDAGVEIDGVRFWGSPWQPEYNEWAFNLPRGEALREKWTLIPEGLDVLVTHGPPLGYGDRSSTSGREGCADLLARVRAAKPRLHLFGHIHEDGGAWQLDGTWIVNCTTWECERAPTVIDIEIDSIRIEAPAPRS